MAINELNMSSAISLNPVNSINSVPIDGETLVLNISQNNLERELLWMDEIVNQIHDVNQAINQMKLLQEKMTKLQSETSRLFRDLLTLLAQSPTTLQSKSLAQALISLEEE